MSDYEKPNSMRTVYNAYHGICSEYETLPEHLTRTTQLSQNMWVGYQTFLHPLYFCFRQSYCPLIREPKGT